jgi:hypothetical protein
MPPAGRIVGMAAGVIPIVGHLPEAGGTLDQSAWLLEAFSILNDTEQKLAPPTG